VSGLGIPLGNARKEERKSTFESAKVSIFFHVSAPQITARIEISRMLFN
jgi:hypothetical protein